MTTLHGLHTPPDPQGAVAATHPPAAAVEPTSGSRVRRAELSLRAVEQRMAAVTDEVRRQDEPRAWMAEYFTTLPARVGLPAALVGNVAALATGSKWALGAFLVGAALCLPRACAHVLLPLRSARQVREANEKVNAESARELATLEECLAQGTPLERAMLFWHAQHAIRDILAHEHPRPPLGRLEALLRATGLGSAVKLDVYKKLEGILPEPTDFDARIPGDELARLIALTFVDARGVGSGVLVPDDLREQVQAVGATRGDDVVGEPPVIERIIRCVAAMSPEQKSIARDFVFEPVMAAIDRQRWSSDGPGPRVPGSVIAEGYKRQFEAAFA